MRGAAIALLVTAVGCSAPLDEELGVSAQPITQTIGLPFPAGHTAVRRFTEPSSGAGGSR